MYGVIMDAEDLKSIQSALQQYLFEAPDAEESVAVLLQHPLLLSDFADSLFESLIKDAREEGSEDLAKFYHGRHLLLRAVKDSLSKKNLALLRLIEEIKLNKNDLAKIPSNKSFEFQDLLGKVQAWLKAPTREKGIKVLQQNPELLTDQPERMFNVLMDDARQQGNEFFLDVLRAQSEFFRILRLELGEKTAVASKDDLKRAVEYALDNIEFPIFMKDNKPSTFLA